MKRSNCLSRTRHKITFLSNFTFTSPSASYDKSPDLLHFSTQVLLDDDIRYALKAEVRSDAIDESLTTRYRPTLEVTLPGRPPASLTAALLHTAGKRVKVELDVENVFRLPLSAKGDLSMVTEGGVMVGF